MKKILLILIVGLFINNLIAQDSIKTDYRIKGNAKILIGLSAILPSSETTIQIKNINKITETDSLGFFQFDNLQNGQYLVHIIGNGFKSKDTSVIINNKSINNLQLFLISDCEINRQIADLDIKKGKPRLLIFGGIAPVIYSGQEKFENKYGINYYDYGCIIPNKDCAIDYNKRIFEYLDLKFGKIWRKQVRKDIVGL